MLLESSFPLILIVHVGYALFFNYIVACSRKPEHLNQSGRPLLDNGYDKTKYAALSM
jgi:hypothetical protein